MSSSNLIRWGGLAMMLGGLLWVLMYGTEILLGVKTGEPYGDPGESVLAWLGPASFSGAIFFLGIGFVGPYVRLRERSKKLGIAGLLLESVAIVAAAVNLSLLTGVVGEVREFEPLGLLGVVGTFVGGCLLLGVAALRAESLPRWARVLLPTVGILFWPLIFATIPLESVLPVYVIMDLPFPIAGVALVFVGHVLSSGRESSVEPRPAVSVSLEWRTGFGGTESWCFLPLARGRRVRARSRGRRVKFGSREGLGTEEKMPR